MTPGVNRPLYLALGLGIWAVLAGLFLLGLRGPFLGFFTACGGLYGLILVAGALWPNPD